MRWEDIRITLYLAILLEYALFHAVSCPIRKNAWLILS